MSDGNRVEDFDADDGQSDEGLERIRRFLYDFGWAINDFFERPPAGLDGQMLEDLRDGWKEVYELRDELSGLVDGKRYECQMAGLTGAAGTSKFRLWVNNRLAFLKLRNARRASRLCNVGATIMGSLADALGLGHAWKEVAEGIKYLTDLAIEEGAR
jgi:hypothetical protein